MAVQARGSHCLGCRTPTWPPSRNVPCHPTISADLHSQDFHQLRPHPGSLLISGVHCQLGTAMQGNLSTTTSNLRPPHTGTSKSMPFATDPCGHTSDPTSPLNQMERSREKMGSWSPDLWTPEPAWDLHQCPCTCSRTREEARPPVVRSLACQLIQLWLRVVLPRRPTAN